MERAVVSLASAKQQHLLDRLLDSRLIEALPLAAYAFDTSGRIRGFNRRARELWGRAPNIGDDVELFWGSFKLHMSGEPLADGETPMAYVLRTGMPLRDKEASVERPDRTRVVCVMHIDPVRDYDGALIGAINFVQDINKPRDAESKLRRKANRFQEILQALPAALYTTDARGRITFYNEAAAALWDQRPELGKSEWCGSWRLYWPDGRPMRHDECPMAVALKEGRPIRGAEAEAERPDGTRVPFVAYPTPLRDETGALTGAVNMLIDIRERRRAEQVGQLLASIIESSDDAILSKTLDGMIITWNRGAERLFGYTAEEVVGKSVTILIPQNRHDEEPKILERIARGERIEYYETIRRRKDGSLIDISLSVSPIKDADGKVIGASKIARDISERRRAREQQDLLLKEMSHRVKNLFAVTSSLVAMSARSARTPEEMATAVRARLGALTRAHELTRPGLTDGGDRAERNTTLHDLLGAIFAPYVDPEFAGDHERVIISGPDVSISGRAVTSLALVLHEFATNAAKYGALSSPEGYICVDCTFSSDNKELVLTWKECGGPAVKRCPEGEGFGSRLARQIINGQFGGHLSHNWRREGLTMYVLIKVENLGN